MRSPKHMTDKQKHRWYVKQLAKEIASKKLGGSFVECGVKYGTSAIIIAKEMQTKGYLFDTWKKFEGMTVGIDGSERRYQRIRRRKGRGIGRKCKKAIRAAKVDHLCEMIRGDVRKTIPVFIREHPTMQIDFMHLDLDLYLPTLFSLETLWPILHDDGCVLVHDYGSKWKGVKKCVDEFVESHSIGLEVLDIYACILRKQS